jgi:hypothetical protein
MPPIPFATNYLIASLLTIFLPLGLLISLTVWYTFVLRRVPPDTPVSSPSLPRPEVVKAAAPSPAEDAEAGPPAADS